MDERKKCFGDPCMKEKRASQALAQHAQVPGEMCAMYVEKVTKLCRSVNLVMADEVNARHLLKGIAKDVYHYLIGKDDLNSSNYII